MGDRQSSGGRWRQIAVWGRHHLRVWVSAAIAVNLALITLATMLMQLPGQRDTVVSTAILVVLVCAALSIVLPVLGHRLEEGRQLDEESRQHQRQVAALLAHGLPDQLPRLEQLGEEQFGATVTRYIRNGRAPYIPRQPDDGEIRAALAAEGPPHSFVLVWGPTKAGKSRTLAEAIRAALPANTQVLIPDGGGPALAELARLGLPFVGDGPALVFLDDLTVADLEALTANVLEIVARRAVLAASMTAERRSQVRSSDGDVTRTARAALARTHNDGEGHELVFRPPTEDELVLARKLYPAETFRGSIAETLVGGAELIAKYRAGQDVNPAGCAIVQAAVDCRRAGVNRPIADAELRRLFALYLPWIRGGMAATYRHGLNQWATVPIASQVALLNPPWAPEAGTPATSAGWTALDHLLSADDGGLASYPARPIPEMLWAELIELGTPVDAHAITFAAYQRHQIGHATTAARKATTDSDPEVSLPAALSLGLLLVEQGHVEEARAAYQLAIDSRRPEQSPEAVRRMSLLDQHRHRLVREGQKKRRLSNEVMAISRRLAEKRRKITKATTESTRKSQQSSVDRLERDLVRAEAKVVDQDKVIASLQRKIAREEAAEQKRRDRAQAQRESDRARRDQAVDRDLDSLAGTASGLDARLAEVEAVALSALAHAVGRDPVRRQYDVFLSFATPDETAAGNLRDELKARGLDVWMVDAQLGLGESLVTGIDIGIASSRCGICLVTPDYIDPGRFWPRQELAALIMGRKRVIPVISGLSFNEVQEFSALLGDRKGLSTDTHGLDEIAELIADAVGGAMSGK